MSSKSLLGVAVVVAAAAVIGLGASLPPASTRAPAADKAEYLPVQKIRYDFGSKTLSGYFMRQDAACALSVMVAEKADADVTPSQTPARLRLVLQPGQVVGLDSEEGRSVNLTCGPDAATLLADTGERAKLMALQQLARQNPAAAVN